MIITDMKILVEWEISLNKVRVQGVNRVFSTNNQSKERENKRRNNNNKKNKKQQKEIDTFTKQSIDSRFEAQNEFSNSLNKLRNKTNN